MPKPLLIINPVAGKLIARTEFFGMVNVFCRAGYTVTTQITQFTGHGTQLARNAFQEGYSLIVCCGGDGTLNEVITGVLQAENPIPLGYIPAGSTNDFARTLKIPMSPTLASEAILKKNSITISSAFVKPKQRRCYPFW